MEVKSEVKIFDLKAIKIPLNLWRGFGIFNIVVWQMLVFVI